METSSSFGAGGHACNCIGCCECGMCRTTPLHTPEMCALRRRQWAELEELLAKRIGDGVGEAEWTGRHDNMGLTS